MTDHKDKPVLDEQNFDKLLQAAHVLQEHSRKKQELEARMELHNERLREQEASSQVPLQTPVKEPSRPSDYTLTLAQIVEAQRQIQTRNLTVEYAMAVVVERVAQITGASGAGIGIMEGKMVRYLAGYGAPALAAKTEVPLTKAICAASVRTGQVIRSEDVNVEVLFDPEPCRQRGILSLLVVPIYHDGDIVGALELYFDQSHSFAEQDVHTCQLLAGLVTEAMSRDAGTALKKSMAAERSTMLETIEKLQPKLAALAADRSSGHFPDRDPEATSVNSLEAPGNAIGGANGSGASRPAEEHACWRCRGKLQAEEQFCGKCGAPRASNPEPYSMQSKLASAAWKQQGKRDAGAVPGNGAPHSDSLAKDLMAKVPVPLSGNGPELESSFVENTFQEAFARLEAQETEAGTLQSENLGSGNVPSREKDSSIKDEHKIDEEQKVVSLSAPALDADEKQQTTTTAQFETDVGNDAVGEKSPDAPASGQDDLVWTSAAKTRDFLESLAAVRSPNPLLLFWRSRRGDFYLAIALVLLVAVIRWGIVSSHPVSATDRRAAVSSSADRSPQPSPNADLSTFDKFLISVGLAEAPEVPEYKGNPNTQVWVDLHTALYYCPGSDLYSKTAKGKLTSQRDAQLDHFEPANRKPCE